MKTIQIERFVHELPTSNHMEDWEKRGKRAKPPRGPRCGVMVARVVDDSHYAIAVSLCNPGRETKSGLVGADTFHSQIGVKLALGSMVLGENLPKVFLSSATTNRARNIQAQFDDFLLQAAKVFKDKTRRTAAPVAA